ncbi:Uma2 family endonuclease [Phormidium tenue]|jgi:Uma2 family endonuclease|uniref:Uma2 family endonuclease n=1 Tax=Phormidium tenue FACHB-1050 TaxID=2692857 RepID=A0ABR8CCA7_9CYAN|nr:Uma2 family endonuclease [Phormidium tenue]MBD2318236.1 Uma2 family endonuclease [Phormidium tenue FACHB-1050]
MTNAISTLETIYPSSDGQPMAESTEHYQWIVTIAGGLEDLFKDDDNVFVAGDLLWYPIEGQAEIRRAPDAMVVFGRPKGARGSYIQHLEAGIAPQVVFEVLSRGNRISEMARKFEFYQTYGVEEYYVYDHLANDLVGWIRNPEDHHLEPIADIQNWISPRLGIRFELTDETLKIFKPDGTRFLTYLEQPEQATAERVAKEQALDTIAKFAAKLREMGVDPENL